MGTFYDLEQFKFVLKFSEVNDQLEDYIVSTDARISANGACVVESDFDFKSSLSSPAVLFTLQPSSNSITILDYDGLLNPLNTNSDYYGYMCQGLKILAYIGDYVDDIEEYDWSPYGTWYVSDWTGGMEHGGITAVTIGCDDLLSEIAAFDLSSVEYSGSTALHALNTVLTAVGLTVNDYVVDTNLDLTFPYTSLQPTVAQTINDILTIARGYCSIKHDDKLVFMSMSNAATWADSYDVGNTLGALTQSMTTAVNYSRVVVKYPNGSNSQLARVITNYAAAVTNGTNTIKLTVPSGILSIEALRVVLTGCNNNESCEKPNYTLAGTELTITLNATLQQPRTAYIDVYVTTPTSESTNEISISIDGIVSSTSYAYEYDASFTTDEQLAEEIAESLAQALKSMRASVACKTSHIAPRINIGDTIEISGVSDEYDGTYALVSMGISIGSSYNTSIKLLKYQED